jgi:hypothetical protein
LPREIVSAAANGGVSVHAEFEAAGTAPINVRVGLRNTRSAPISTVQMQLNRNRFSLAPAAQIDLSQPIAAGATWTTLVPLTLTDGHFAQSQGVGIQCGVSVDGKVATFTLDVPPNLLLAFCPDMQKNDYARHWQSMDPATERAFSIGRPAADFESSLREKRFVVVARVQGGANGGERLFCCCKLHTGVTALCEIQLATGDVTVRSANPTEASDILQKALGVAKPSPSAPSIDDLFS